jgi:hypothetical protein
MPISFLFGVTAIAFISESPPQVLNLKVADWLPQVRALVRSVY